HTAGAGAVDASASSNPSSRASWSWLCSSTGTTPVGEDDDGWLGACGARGEDGEVAAGLGSLESVVVGHPYQASSRTPTTTSAIASLRLTARLPSSRGRRSARAAAPRRRRGR